MIKEILFEYGGTIGAPYGRDQYTRMGHIKLLGTDNVDYGLNTNGASWTALSYYMTSSPTNIGLPPNSSVFNANNTGYKWIKVSLNVAKDIKSIIFYQGHYESVDNLYTDYPHHIKITLKDENNTIVRTIESDLTQPTANDQENKTINTLALKKFLIKQGTSYYSTKPEFYQNLLSQPFTDSDLDNLFMTYGTDDLSQLTVEKSQGTVTAINKDLGSGNLFSFDIKPSFKSVNTINVKKVETKMNCINAFGDLGNSGNGKDTIMKVINNGIGGELVNFNIRTPIYPIVEFEKSFSLSKIDIVTNAEWSSRTDISEIYGSNDGSNFGLLYQKNDDIGIPNGINFFNFNQYYKYYKFRCNTAWSANCGDGATFALSISKFNIYSCNIVKFLIQDKDSKIYKFDGTNIVESPSQTLDENNFVNNGFNDPTLISELLWDSVFLNKDNLKLLMYNSDTTSNYCSMDYNCNEFKILDKLKENNDGKFNILSKEF